MKRAKLTVALVGAVLLGLAAAPAGRAGGYENFGLGARAQGMGGAYIAVADDWTSGYWNPAGLGRVKDGSVGADVLFVQPTMRGSNSYANYTPDQAAAVYQWTKDMFVNYSGTEPMHFEKSSTVGNYINPQGLGACYALNDTFTVGLLAYQPLGYSIDWSDTIPYFFGDIYGSNWQRLVTISTQLTLGAEIAPGVFAGAGVAVLYDQIKRESEKDVNSMTGMPGLDYSFRYKMDNDGLGCEGSFGVLAEVLDWLSLGGVFRTGASVRLTGDATSSLTLMGLSESSDVVQKFRHPATWGVGVALKPLERFLVSLDLNQSLWSAFRTYVDFDDEGMLLQDQDFSEDWKNAEKIRVGCEYRASEKVALRGGFCYDESPMPSKSVSLAFIPDTDKKYVTLGLGYLPSEDWEFNFFGAGAWGNRSAQQGDFEQRIWGVGVDASWHF